MMSQRSEAGMTVVELMVAVLLAAILSAGLFYMMMGQTNTYNAQLKNLSTQQNVWAAMEYLQRHIRSAGYGMAGCPNSMGQLPNLPTGWMAGMKVYNNCSLWKSTDKCATIDQYGSGTSGDAHGVDSLEVSATSTTMLSGGLGSIRITQQWNGNQTYTAECGGLDVAGMTPMLAVFWDPADPSRPCTLATLTTAKGKDGGPKGDCKVTTTHGGDPWGINDPAGLKGEYFPPGSVITMLGNGAGESIKFAIDVDHDPPRLMQWQVTCSADSDCDPTSGTTKCPKCPPGGTCVDKRCTNDVQVVAMGIEDMQISYACDYNTGTGNGPACNRLSTPWAGCKGSGADKIYYEAKSTGNDEYDEWAYNVSGDEAPGCYIDKPAGCVPGPPEKGGTCASAPIGVVRITLIGRGVSAELGTKAVTGRPAAEDHAAGTADSYERAMISATVVPRNLVR